MMWINDEVDLPQALIIAQREGRLVVFAGAGVSMGAPSNLPSFEDLQCPPYHRTIHGTTASGFSMPSRMVETKHRARWAEQFCRYAESLTTEGADALWNRWVRAYWDDRITGVPQPLDEGERQAMVCWILPFRAHSPEVVARIVTALPRRIDHFTFYRLDQSGLATFNAAEMGRLLRAVLHSVEGVDYDNGELLSLATSAFEGGAAREDLLVAADDMARLGIAGADQLRAMIDGGT